MVCNEHHSAEVTSAREVADEEVANNSTDILAQIQSEFTLNFNNFGSLPSVHAHIKRLEFLSRRIF